MLSKLLINMCNLSATKLLFFFFKSANMKSAITLIRYAPSMGKRVYIGFESAQAFWRQHDGNDLRSYERLELAAPLSACANSKAIEACGLDAELFVYDGKLVVAVATPEERRKSERVIARMWNRPCVYYRVADGIYVASPEDTALQLASKMAFEEALLYLYELVGTYARHGSRDSTIYDRVPLCTVASLARRIEETEGIRGIKMLREAVRFVQGNSASPMESILTAQFVLPPSNGGFGFELPILNQRIVTTSTRAYRKADLYWPRHGIDLEYQSEYAHAGYEQTVRDGMRSNELVAAANKVFEANRDHFRIPGAMEILAKQLSDAMGCRPPDMSAAAKACRTALRERLLAVDGKRPSRKRTRG